MKEIIGDLFSQECDAICITTNGTLRKSGAGIMGAGVALAAKERWPELQLEKQLGYEIQRQGNKVGWLYDTWWHMECCLMPCGHPKYAILSLPTKNDWRDNSDINLIEASVKQLVQITDQRGWNRVCLTRPGCGNGGLEWWLVRQKIVRYLNDRFCIVRPT